MAHALIRYGDVDSDENLTWEEWADIFYYQYEWEYPQAAELVLVPDVLYDVCAGNGHAVNSTDSILYDEL